MKNNVQLITYIDRLTGSDVNALHNVLMDELNKLFSGIHLLPFYYPIDGSDAGFDPIDHTQVDSRLGAWHDIKEIGSDFDVMADLIVNHMSAQSKEFEDVLAKGKQSPYWDLFITEEKIFPQGLSHQQREKIYRPRPGSCFTEFSLPDNQKAKFWTTFTDNQVDIDVNSDCGKHYLHNILTTFSENNIKIIRLDAAGYAIKKADTSCFMIEETYDFINELTVQANQLGIETLVEIHSYYQTQIEIAKRVDQVYDFALPPLILHSLFTRCAEPLVRWLSISPRNCITVLDTHDGIGIIDVGPMNGQAGLLTETEIDGLVETIHDNSKGESKQATGAAASNVDLYQVNCTYYDALGQNDVDYLIARAIQFFAPGVPQVYYAGLLGQTNDLALLSQTNVGRDINRPYLNKALIKLAVSKPITQALFQLIKIRNSSNAFNGEFSIRHDDTLLFMTWINAGESASLTVNFEDKQALIILADGKEKQRIELHSLLSKQR
ncbi:sucrose phosphorylase [Colwelliaceae bacterium 6471]